MSRFFCVVALSPLLWLVVTPGRSADDVKLARTSVYFPLEVGTTWHYRAGDARFKVTVAKHEKVGDVVAAKLETYGEKDKLLSDEYVAIVEDVSKTAVTPFHVVRVKSKSDAVTPPLPFLKLPRDEKEKDREKAWKGLKGASWNVASKVGGKDVKGVFEISSIDEVVKVPAGSYRSVVVKGKNLEVLGNKLELTYQFAEDVGMVKQTMEIGEGNSRQKVVVELEKFEKGK